MASIKPLVTISGPKRLGLLFQNLNFGKEIFLPCKFSIKSSRSPHSSPVHFVRRQFCCKSLLDDETKSEAISSEAFAHKEWPLDWSEGNAQQIAMGVLVAATILTPVLPVEQFSAPIYFAILALWAIYVGSHRSLGVKLTQTITFEQSFAVPFFCSITLFGLYCLLKIFPDLNFGAFLSIYLNLVGTLAVTSNLSEPIKKTFPELNQRWSTSIELPKWMIKSEEDSAKVNLTSTDIISLLLAILITFSSHQPWAPFTIKNFIAVCITSELIQLVSLGRFATSAVMLIGLLFYDVFWVFGSSHIFGDNVMVTVATSQSLDGPMKLIFPSWKSDSPNAYSILGLGDIAAPGLLVAQMLRLDKAREQKSTLDEVNISREAEKSYFLASLTFYVLGLGTTIGANAYSQAAQPALLYLVPFLVGGIFLYANSKSELDFLWNYRDTQGVLSGKDREIEVAAVPVKVEEKK